MSSTAKNKRKTAKLPRMQFPKESASLDDHLDDQAEVREFVYRVRDSGELVVVLMTNPERWELEEAGFLTLPDGREARYSPIEHIIADRGMPPELAERVRQSAKWPMHTCLMGVNPDQVGELRAHLREHDIRGVDVKPDGTLEIADRRAHRDYCHATGQYVRNAGYGDAAPRNR